ncbi:ATP synthase F1 subunit gamma [candidate division WWE3 bacterium]|uniref:ATP synthase gamma chain n=1 Tax=candidate division WWE3 bacterium TaxID=2053526 RepID=A0A955LKP7_UNCKA|nr:ATP synthase F1 subunit gamma [candidate division WWE3 bacterium]
MDNISKVTHAMQLVAASRMRRAQDNAMRGKSYTHKIKEMMVRLSANKNVKGNAFIEPEYADNVSGTMLVVFSPERGLAGALPGNLTRYVLKLIESIEKDGSVSVITVGKKVRDLLARRGVNIIADFSDMPEQPTTADVRPLLKLVEEGYTAREFGEVLIVLPQFVNAMTQIPVTRVLLPLDLDAVLKYDDSLNVEDSGGAADFIFEPNIESIFAELIPGYLETQIYQARLETVASEYSARMVAMKNATTNAKDVRSYLSLEYNKSRQAQITRELAEISAGRMGKG